MGCPECGQSVTLRTFFRHQAEKGYDMIGDYKFGEVERQNCFEDGVNDILYFPIVDSNDFPSGISEKAEKIIERIVHTS